MGHSWFDQIPTNVECRNSRTLVTFDILHTKLRAAFCFWSFWIKYIYFKYLIDYQNVIIILLILFIYIMNEIDLFDEYFSNHAIDSIIFFIREITRDFNGLMLIYSVGFHFKALPHPHENKIERIYVQYVYPFWLEITWCVTQHQS